MQLSAPGQRVLGCLIEKALATPNQYPLSINALQAACNQLTGRDPVTDYDEATVRSGLDDLKAHQLVKAEYARGSRTPRYAHRLPEQVDLDEAQVAVIALLLLRGPQTPGELRSRSERLHAFPDLGAVDATLTALAEHRFGALVEVLPRQPGHKEARWRHLLGGEAPAATAAEAPPPAAAADPEVLVQLRADVGALRTETEQLRAEVAALRAAVSALEDRHE
jgi:uncharacterized protein